MNEKNVKRIQTALAILKFTILIGLIVGIPLFIYFNHPDLIDQFNSLDKVNAYLDQYKTGSIFVYFGLQVVQIIISIIPGQALQFAAGYAYQIWLGYLITIIGIGLGSSIAFFLAKFLGRDFIHLIFGEERIKKYVKMLNSKRALILIFIIFLIPGIPKDLFTYAAGISEMDIRPFLGISLIARTPGIIVSLLIGNMFSTESYVGMVILIVVSLILCILGIIYRKKLQYYMNKLYDKVTRKYGAGQ